MCHAQGANHVMASRLNLLFQVSPRQFLEKTVLFTDGLAAPESLALMRNRIAHHIDLQPRNERVRAQVLSGLHLYADSPLTSYFVPPQGFALIQKENPPQRFVFFPEFSGSRILISPSGTECLRVGYESGLTGKLPAPEARADSPYTDSFSFWEHTTGHLVGKIRSTAILFKEPTQPWTVIMQQIVGTPGLEVVRSVFSRPLRY